MKIRLAKSAGFCYGVKRAVELAESAAQSGEPCVMLGYIIHNSDVVDRLASQGVKVVEDPDQVPQGCGVIIRSHGESRETYERLEKRGFWTPPAQTSSVSIRSFPRRRSRGDSR